MPMFFGQNANRTFMFLAGVKIGYEAIQVAQESNYNIGFWLAIASTVATYANHRNQQGTPKESFNLGCALMGGIAVGIGLSMRIHPNRYEQMTNNYITKNRP